MRLPVLLIACFGLVICMTIFKQALGQDEEGPPRIYTAPRPATTAEGQGYTYTWCEYTPFMTCYDTTVSTAARPMDGPQRLAVPVQEKVNFSPLIAVIMFSVVTGVIDSLRDSATSNADQATSSIAGIVTTTQAG